MSNREKFTGKAKEVTGKVTGDEELEEQGRTQHAKGEAKETIADAKAKVTGAWDAAREAVTGNEDDEAAGHAGGSDAERPAN